MTEDLSSVLWEATILLLVGMSVVFVFLTILIGAITLIEKICAKYPGEDSTPAAPPVTAPTIPTQAADSVTPQVVAAITAAVHKHRNQ